MSDVTFEIEGLSELEEVLATLSKSAGKGVMRRSLKKSAEPMAEIMRNNAPKDSGDLAESIAVSTKLSRRQGALHRKMFRDDKQTVEMFVGAGPVPQATLQEFGAEDFPAQPFARPAWDADKMKLLDRLGKNLWTELEKSIARAARKAAKAK